MKLKKYLCTLFAALTALTLLLASGCDFSSDGKLHIVCTIFPQYDWVRELTKGAQNVEVTLLEDSGADLHNFQPSAADKVSILNADFFVYTGGESDDWARTLLENAEKDVRSLDLIEALGERALTEEEGIEESGEHGHEHEDEVDEHIWLSVQNAKVLVSAIQEELCAVDEGNAALYQSNAASYLAELSALDEAFEETVSSAKRSVLVFADRYPFRYLAHDYGLTCYAAFSGCSAESEASFATILALVKHVEENALPYVMVLENNTQGIAKQVIDNTKSKDQGILVLNSLQSVTREDIESGATYLGLMKEDLAVLKTALN
ncbi:MAG TPA: metal ABC transporter substrate-binding protein [Candidatus Gallimonas gallistercoris]|uniref:Metal ABC transporter substrate-binding protein n=1 Tax=Candidatus Gallimonas gallistercoris TaxID=2838602 RepID=A0A9D2KFA5_9FIRM|nr:metal ABC transporter substrate-binding protein [Candidatus Gallimonas gallistercoris]